MAARQGLVAFEAMEVRRLFATDLVSDAVGLHAAASIEVAGTSYFFADDGIHGRELWKTDGSPEGTVLVKDLTPGAGGTDVESFFHVGDRVVFLTVQGPSEDHEYTLWSSDGSSEGTLRLAQWDDVVVLKAAQVEDRVAIVFSTPGVDAPQLHDAHLYFTDGTQAGTDLVHEWFAKSPNPDGSGGGVSFPVEGMWTSGERAVFSVHSVWSSNGTGAGTIALGPALDTGRDGFFDTSGVFEASGKVVIPSPGKLFVTDGTLAGTDGRTFAISGHLEHGQYAHAGNLFYFVEVRNNDAGTEITKTLFAYDLNDETLTPVYETPETATGSEHIIVLPTADRVLLDVLHGDDDEDDGNNTRSLWDVNGVVATKIMDLDRHGGVFNAVSLGGVAYLVIPKRGTEDFEVNPDDEDGLGELGSRRKSGQGASVIGARGGETSRLHLWRTDGTPAGTGIVRTIWEGDAGGKQILGTLSVATGKLLVRTEVSTGVRPGPTLPDDSPLVNIWDDTLAYEPAELSIERDFATARLVNGVLRLNGSKQPDVFRMYRPERDQSLLVVEVNGVARSFPFGSIRRIVADLQDGNDKYDVVEYPGGEIRLWTSILGGDGADTILTGTGRDTIIGGSGPDTIRSRGNADLVVAGGGRDRITGGEGDDVIAGGTGHDSIITSAGHDVLFGQSAVERTFGQLWEDGDEEEDVLLPALI